jgi:cyclopropane fatty-acyl-phospholipid synthase-like methyltransferase
VDVSKPIDLDPTKTPRDSSGTPIAYLESIRARDDLIVVANRTTLDILVEFPISKGWQQRLGVERFYRLRTRHKGKGHAVVVSPPADPAPSQRPPRSRRRSSGAPLLPGEAPLIPYAEEDPVGRKVGYEGAGIMAYQTQDQMHPPMVDSVELWENAANWPEAAREHTRAAARALDLKADERILDIGCGIGGPARQLVDEFGVEVYGVANSENMLDTARRINDCESRWRDRIELEFHDCQEPYGRRGLDVAWSMNMIYRVPDKGALIRNASAALAPAGRMMVEDWMFTPLADATDRGLMDLHYHGVLIATADEIESLLTQEGLEVVQTEDLGHVGRTHMKAYCLKQFNSVVRPRIEADFPGHPINGKQMADEWAEATASQIEMYVSEKLTYRRYVAIKRQATDLGVGARRK